MPAIACATCFKFFRTRKVGVAIEEGMPVTGEDGTEQWQPYKLWAADLFECPGCGARVVSGFGRGPLAEHYQSDYAAKVAAFGPIGRVDDCGGARP